MNRELIATFVFFNCLSCVLADDAPPAGAAPPWFLKEIATLTAGSGRWVTDNSDYRTEQEPFDAYATEWVSSFDGTTMRGRLFGFKDGKETADFWEFRVYWHPQQKQAVIEQFGWGGTLGTGSMWQEGTTTKSDQIFYTVDGGANRTGHVSTFPDAGTQVTASFNIDGETWTPRREYTWRLTPSPGGQASGKTDQSSNAADESK